MDGGPNSGIAGMILKPWDERERTAAAAQPAGPGQAQRDHRRAGLRLLAAAAAGLDRRPAGADGDQLARGLRDRVQADGGDQGRGPQERPVHRHRQRPRLQQSGDPGPHRPLQGQRSRHHHGRRSARRWRPWSAATTSTGSTSNGRSYEVIPQVPRVEPADAGEPGPVLRRRRASGEPVPLSTVVTDRDRHRAQRADPVQPAQLGHLLGGADARRDHGPGGGLPRAAGARAAAGRLPARLPVRLAAIRHRGQPADGHLRVRADRDLPGPGGAVRVACAIRS